MKKATVLGLFVCVVFLTIQAMAQLSTTTSLVGTVTDSSGAAIPNATVVAVNVATHDTFRTVTTGQGGYSFPIVHIGTYSITASANGFQTTTHTGIIVESNQTVRGDFTLKVGQSSQKVVVTGGVPPISTDDSSVSQIINHQQIADLPLNGRDPLMLATTTPGVILGLKTSASFNPGEDFIGAGAREVQNDITLDGVNIMDNLVSFATLRPSLEAIQEAQVQTGTFPAQFGGYMGVHVNLVSKSGTNQLHGSVFEFVRNDMFDAREFFEQPSSRKAPFHRNQFGAEAGGPVVIPKLYNGKNKTFFMVDYEGLRQAQSSSSVSTVLTPKMRAGNFSEISTPITNPLLPGNPVIAGNVIPSADIAPQAIKLLQFLPTANLPGLTQNYAVSVPFRDSWDQTIDRVDENLGEKARLFFRFAYLTDSPFYGNVNPFLAAPGPNTDSNWVAAYTQTFSPTMLNDFRVGHQMFWVDSSNIFFGNPALQKLTDNLGIPGFQPTSRNPGVPVIGIAGYLGIGSGVETKTDDQTWQVSDQFSYVHGTHNIMAGFDLSKFRIERQAVNNPLGSFTFSGTLSGNAAAEFMLGIPLSDSSPEALVNGIFGEWRNGFFVLDKWGVTPKLTLNIGLRYEIPTAVKTLNGFATILNSTNTALIPADAPRPGFVLVPAVWTALAPRFGFAYRLTDKWVARGGFGVYYNPNHLNDFTLLDLNPPFAPSFNYFNAAGVPPTVTFSNPTPSSSISPPPPTNVITLDHNLKLERMNQWSASVERALWANAGLDISYLGKYSYHLDRSFYNNTPLPGPGAIQARRPNQLWGTIRTIKNDDIAHYDALSVVLTQRMNHGATLLASYTWAHALDEGSDSNSTPPMNPYNVKLDYGNANWDIRHRFVANYTYALPFLRNSKNGFIRRALGGWQINGITTLQTGIPFNVTISGDNANNGLGGQRPNLIAKPSTDCGASRLTNCVTSSAFAMPAPYTFGNAGRNILHGPGVIDFDFSFFKDVPINERTRFQFRAEFFNGFNHPSFANPGATFGTATFGTVGSTTSASREIQFAGKFLF